MHTPRISASSYSNTAPLIWSFLYGSRHGTVELILDNAPARSAQLLGEGRVDAALVPVIAYHQFDDNVRLIPDVCVGAKEKVQSVCLVTRGRQLSDVRSVALDISSRTSVVLTKIIFREFLGFEPEWRDASPDLETMLDSSDCALLIGDPALSISDWGFRISDFSDAAVAALGLDGPNGTVAETVRDDSNSALRTPHSAVDKSQIPNPKSQIRVFDLAELWRSHTGLGFIFAMWMTRSGKVDIDFASARDEGLARIDEIVSNYLPDIRIDEQNFRNYLCNNISYSIDESLQRGMEMYFSLAEKHRLCENVRELRYAEF